MVVENYKNEGDSIGDLAEEILKKTFRLLFVIFLITFSMAGCGKKQEGPTSDLNLHQSAPGFFTETDYGYYFNYQGFFYFSDKDSVNFRKLCNKPNCSHNDENCNAYNHDSFLDTNFCNGKLYYCYVGTDRNGNSELIIESKNFDGSDTKKEKSIDLSYGYFSGKMHRNYLVYNIVTEENGRQDSKLFIQDLEKIKEAPEVVCEISCGIEEQNPYIFVDVMVGESVYYTLGEKKYQYHIKDKKTNSIPLKAERRKGLYYTENEIYELDAEDHYRKIVLKDGTVTDPPLEKNSEELGPVFFDNTYMYRINYTYGSLIEVPKEKEGIFVYDRNGKSITFIPYSLPTNHEIMFVAAEDKVFLFRVPDGGKITTYSYFKK